MFRHLGAAIAKDCIIVGALLFIPIGLAIGFVTGDQSLMEPCSQYACNKQSVEAFHEKYGGKNSKKAENYWQQHNMN